jgi:predicted site-specific integrase-resolvase
MSSVQKDFISIKEASILTGIQAQTLRKMGDEGVVRMYRTASGQRKFHRESLTQMCYAGGAPAAAAAAAAPPPAAGTESGADAAAQPPTDNKQHFIYCRVSSRSSTGELEKQKTRILELMENAPALKEDIKKYRIINDISTGTTFQRKGLQQIINACMNKTIGNIVVLRKTRISLFGIGFFEQIVNSCGGTIIELETHDSTSGQDILGELIGVLQKTKIDISGLGVGAASVVESMDCDDDCVAADDRMEEDIIA